MTLSEFLEAVEHTHRTIVVYADEDDVGVVDQFDTRNVTVEHRRLPPGDPSGFLTIYDRDGFVGAVGLDELRDLLAPPIYRPWDEAFVSSGYRTLLEILDNTLFTSFVRRQLLATSREIENRAWRVGRGTLRVGFQSFAAMHAQQPVYERLAAETELDVHLYGRGDWGPPEIPDATIHREDAGEIGAYWFLAYDADGDETNECALLAEEWLADQYYGFWTYDADLVDHLLGYLVETYG